MDLSMNHFDVISRSLEAQRIRSEVVTRNISSAHVTRTSDGGAYRRQVAVLESIGSAGEPGGVRIREVSKDMSPLRTVRDPGHPDAVDGVVSYPNVDIGTEMVDLVDAGRAYEANLAALRSYKTMLEQTLEMTR